MNVFILATCRRDDLLPFTLLVFDSIRIGFPLSEIRVLGNDLGPTARECVRAACERTHCIFEANGPPTIHHLWIESLVGAAQAPFVILDTDVCFFESVEGWTFDTALAGYRIPEFQDEFTGAITRSRLHTSLLFIDPVKVREQVKAYEAQFPVTPFNPLANLVYPICQPLNGRAYFHDTASLLYHAIGGTAFTDQQKNAYAHLHFGTISDIVLPRLFHGEKMQVLRDLILKNPEQARGLWRSHEEYWAARQPNYDGADVIAKITPEDSRDARAWNEELCCGNREAMAFCDLWYGYVHGIDDAIDTMRDGRPMMSKAQMISLFFGAACLYNSPFYRQNSAMLFPLILDITNNYSISVDWEVAPQAHLRQMADLMRMGSNRMFSMVALIAGGEQHCLTMTKKIQESDWTKQHDADGNPI